MGTSGTMSTSNQYIKYSITVHQNWQNIEGNYSNVSVSVNFWRTNTGYTTYGSGTCYCKINGTTYSASVTPSQKITNSGINLFTKSLNIGHNSDGTKTLTCSAWISMNTPLTSSEQSYSQTLSTIPRATTPTLSASTIEMGKSVTISMPRASSSFTHTLTYGFGNATGTIGTNLGTSATWTLPLSLANQVPKATSGWGTITCTTYNGSTNIGSKSVTFTATVPSSIIPSFTSLSITRDDNDVPADWGIYVQGHSKCTAKIVGATGSYGSTITNHSISGGGYSGTAQTLNTGPITTSGTTTFTATIKDSRGRTASKTNSIYVYPYFEPRITSISVARCLSDGTLDDDGKYLKLSANWTYSDCNSNNVTYATVSYRRAGNSDWISGGDVVSGTDEVFGDNLVSADYSYEVLFELSDQFNTIQQILNISTSYSTIDFLKGGKGIAFGKACENAGFECDMLAKFNRATTISGETVIFEQGMWTPTPSSSGTAPTYSTYYNFARYYRINSLVYITFHMKINITSSGTGYVRIKGLPYIAGSGCDSQAFALREFSGGVSYTDGAVGMVYDDSTQIAVQNVSAITPQKWTTGDTWIGFSGFYIKA